MTKTPDGWIEHDDTCEHCHDSGYIEFASGGIWTGKNITTRRELCDCLCGQDAYRESIGDPRP